MNIPFQQIGIDPDHGKVILNAVQEYIDNHNGDKIPLQKIVESTGLPGDEIKETFFTLLTLRYLKPTFLPRHLNCETVIGQQERSVDEIRKKMEEGEYPQLCSRCHEEIADFDDLEIEIIFWKGRGGLFV